MPAKLKISFNLSAATLKTLDGLADEFGRRGLR